MKTCARILVVEDDPVWIQTHLGILGPVAERIDFATHLEEAQRLVTDRYYNIALVDWSLVIDDGSDNQGLDFLAHLKHNGHCDSIKCIVCSAYASFDRARKAFSNYEVVDFIDKVDFNEDELLSVVNRALAANHLHRPVELEISRRRTIPDLWNAFNWPLREDPEQLEAELRDLFVRLFPGVDHLFIEDMKTGQSGAGVLLVTPRFDGRLGNQTVVKFGKRDKILEERDNYDRHVARFAASQSATQVNAVSGRVMAAIAYTLVGVSGEELSRIDNFGNYFQQHSADEINTVLDYLFGVAGRRWYNNRDNLRIKNLIELYEQTFHLRWDEVWGSLAKTSIDLSERTLYFPGLEQGYDNPKLWLEARDHEINAEVATAIVHGDMNEANILVTSDGRSWLIDFYRTGVGHVLTDAVELETAIKLNLAPVTSLREHAELERRLLAQTRIDTLPLPAPDDPYYKTLAVIGHLRDHADNLTGTDKGMDQYNLGLLMANLTVLGISSLTAVHSRALLSAAMICSRLQHLDAR